jgi:hypothetical protein
LLVKFNSRKIKILKNNIGHIKKNHLRCGPKSRHQICIS